MKSNFDGLGDLDKEHQLVMLRNMTKSTGVVHEAQALQLKLWPYAVDPGIQNSTATLDFEKNVVNYAWTDSDKASDFKPSDDYRQRLARLEESIKFLLGAGWGMVITMNGVEIHPGKKDVRKKGFTAPSRPARPSTKGSRPKRKSKPKRARAR